MAILLLFLILVTVIAILFHLTGLLRSVISAVIFLTCLIVIGLGLLVFADEFSQNPNFRWVVFLTVGIGIPAIVGIRQYFYQRQKRWKEESEKWIAEHKAQRTISTDNEKID